KVSLGVLALSLIFCLSACDNTGTNSNSTSDSVEAADHDMSAMSNTANAMPEAPADAKVFFRNLKDGQTVTSPVKVEMGASGISVDSAGVVKAGSGHHHILVDAGDSMATGTVIPTDANHLHFGNAQTEAEVE